MDSCVVGIQRVIVPTQWSRNTSTANISLRALPPESLMRTGWDLRRNLGSFTSSWPGTYEVIESRIRRAGTASRIGARQVERAAKVVAAMQTFARSAPPEAGVERAVMNPLTDMDSANLMDAAFYSPSEERMARGAEGWY